MKIKDVIYGEIQINEPIIIKLIETLEFQRLRKIKQLGVTNINFPGAEHTRYAHSLGVYEVTKRILENFKAKNVMFFNEFEELSLKIAALLHDLGHGPLSHTFESFFQTSHEEYTVKIIENKKGSIYKILQEYEKENGYNILSDVVSFISKKHQNKALVSIISSSIDADRMDYLLRDTYSSGAVYGNVDINRIITYMEYKDGEIVFSKKAIHTLEDFILSRYHMFIQIYLNEKSLIYEKLIQKILNRVFYLQNKKFEFKTDISLFMKLNKKPIDVNDYIKVEDYKFLSILSDLMCEDDIELKRLCTFLETKISFYEQISKKEYEELEEKDRIKTPKTNKKVYYKKEAIKILNNNQITKVEELSQIFDFCQNKLTIKLEEKYYKIKEYNEK